MVGKNKEDETKPVVKTRKKVARKKTAARRGRPPKSATANAVTKKRVAKKKVAKKRVGRPPKSVEKSVQTTGRRGRPVSVDVLQRKLLAAQEALSAEKEKRKAQVASIKEKMDAAVAAKKELQGRLKEVSSELALMQHEAKRAEKAAAKKLKMEMDRNAAVAKFLSKWEKKYMEAESKSTGRRKKRGPGRPRRS